LRELLRPNDTVARLGGDEFAVLLPAINAAGAGAVARRVAALMSVPFPVDGHSLDMDASIGIALHPDHAQDDATLLQRADVAMYLAKRKGTGYALYDAEQDGHSPARLALMNDLRQALAQRQFVLYYQPIIDLQEDQVIGVEALLRWQHPSHGLVSPDLFIPLAEGSGAIIPLTLWALEEALRQCSAWQRQGLALGIAVNLSTRALHDPRLPAAVGSLLRRYAIKPASLTLEITESCLMTDTARAMPILNRLDELGVRIAIDDFGTGYSSLAYLRHLPVDKLKIDKSFVLGLGVDATDAALVRSIVAMAHELSLSVVAEGVETATAWDLLRTLGDLEAQGHFISRPLPPEDLVRWLADSIWRCHGLSA
jgi:EAL domain-containing protein (putative c-di-GMP-specific phosphodiesterase class I)